MDDEKYFIFYGQNMPQNACYYTDNKDSCPDNVLFHWIDKYPKKILVHVTISDRGISKALVRPSGSLSVNSAIYIKECLEKRLLPFIEEFHIDGNYIFSPIWRVLTTPMRRKPGEEEKSNMSPNTLIRQMSHKHAQSKTF